MFPARELTKPSSAHRIRGRSPSTRTSSLTLAVVRSWSSARSILRSAIIAVAILADRSLPVLTELELMNMATRPTPTGLPTPPPEPRANSHERPKDRVTGWLPEGAKKVDPAGTAYTKIGPGTPAWHAKGK